MPNSESNFPERPSHVTAVSDVFTVQVFKGADCLDSVRAQVLSCQHNRCLAPGFTGSSSEDWMTAMWPWWTWERKNKCVCDLPEELRSAAEHTAPVSCLTSLTSCQQMKSALSFISTQAPWRLMCCTKTTFIPLLLSSLLLRLFHPFHVVIY